jgi:hypothetical protein
VKRPPIWRTSQARKRIARESGLQRRDSGWAAVVRDRFSVMGSCYGWPGLFVERPVGVENLPGAFFEEELVVAKKMVDFFALFDGNEEDLAGSLAPDVYEVLRGEEDGWGVGEGAAEEHRSGAAFYEIDLATEVEGDGGAVGLVAVKENLIVCRDRVVGF